MPTPNFSGKVVLITGGTSGLGAASARALAQLSPSRIYISGRRQEAADELIAQIRNSSSPPSSPSPLITPPTEIIFLPCDLASLSSVSAAAAHLVATETRIDILLANAGVCAVPPTLSQDGYEIQFATNHLGHALLVRKLLPLLLAGGGSRQDNDGELRQAGRVVFVTSFIARTPLAGRGISFDALKNAAGSCTLAAWAMEPAARWARYAESKLANAVYARALGKRYADYGESGIVSVSVTPGFVETGMVGGMGWCDRVSTRLLAAIVGGGEGGMVGPEEGARNQVWACTVAEEELRNGGLYDPVGMLVEDVGAEMWSVSVGERLWEWTEEELKCGGWL